MPSLSIVVNKEGSPIVVFDKWTYIPSTISRVLYAFTSVIPDNVIDWNIPLDLAYERKDGVV
jgi:hypothetical protein